MSGLSQPITYVLQIASDPAFKNLVLEKTGLTGTEYTLSGDEKLPAVKKDAPYYWRVKSVDDASNESTWSEPVPFQVGLGFSLPGWGLAILVVIGVILIGGITFLFGRRTAYGPRPPYS